MGRRWGEGGRRDIVEGSGDEGIFVEEPGGGDVGSEGVYGAGVSVGLNFSSSMRHLRTEGLAYIQTKRGSSFIARHCYLLDSLNL